MFVDGGIFFLEWTCRSLSFISPGKYFKSHLASHTDSWISHSMDSSILDKISLHLHTNRPAHFWVVSLCASAIKMVALLQNTELDSRVCVLVIVCVHMCEVGRGWFGAFHQFPSTLCNLQLPMVARLADYSAPWKLLPSLPSPFPQSWVTNVSHQAWLFQMDAGIQFQVLMHLFWVFLYLNLLNILK